MNKAKDITGQRFGKLVAVRSDGINPTRKGMMWICACDCGNEARIDGRQLRAGATKSCGCIVGKCNRTHGRSNDPTYESWHAMKNRCNNESHNAYSRYGGRGIRVCERWQNSFAAFLNDMG